MRGSYLDGLTAALVLPAVLRGDVWEVFDALDRSQQSYQALSPIEAVVPPRARRQGSWRPRTQPASPSFSALPEAYASRYGARTVTFDRQAPGFAHRDLVYQGQKIGAIHTAFDASHIFAERREILATLLVTNGILAAIFSLGGFLLVRRMIEPMRVLEDHMRAAANGVAEPASRAFPSRGGEVARPLQRLQCARPCRAGTRQPRDAARRGGEAGQPRTAGLRHGARDQQSARRAVQRHRHAEDARRTPGVRDTSMALIERGPRWYPRGRRSPRSRPIARRRSARPLSADDLEDVRC